jgi:hypothetical protein
MPGRVSCHACSADLEFDDPIGRSMRCPRCASDLRCCLNCRFHDIASYNDCAEPAAERVLEKDAANFCDYFSPSGAGSVVVTTRASSSPDGLTELEKLFRKH